jgi:hypothetical protein
MSKPTALTWFFLFFLLSWLCENRTVQPCCEFSTLAERKNSQSLVPHLPPLKLTVFCASSRFEVWWKYTELSTAAAGPTRAQLLVAIAAPFLLQLQCVQAKELGQRLVKFSEGCLDVSSA